jgi:hypothetical protein
MHRRFNCRASLVLFCSIGLLGFASPVRGDEPIEVQFDCRPAVACRDVTPPEFLYAHPQEKVVEAVIRVSVRASRGNPDHLQELLFELRGPQRRMRVLDFSPTNQLESEATDPIQVTEIVEDSRSVGISLGGKASAPVGDIKIEAAPQASLGKSKRNVVTESWKKRPPQRAVVISGTTNDGFGVFYKFKPSSQSSLEGVKELTCRFAVPSNWRGDWLLLSCRASGDRLKYFVKTTTVCGRRRDVLGLYLEGDPEAQEAAEQLSYVQAEIRGTAPSDDEALAGQSDRLRRAAEGLYELSSGWATD